MNEVIPFEYSGAEIRALLAEDGEPWFVAKEVAEILGYDRPRNMLRVLDDDEKGAQKVSTLGGLQEMTVIKKHNKA